MIWFKKETYLRNDRIGLAHFLRQHPHQGSIIIHRKRRILYMKAAKTGGTSVLRKTLEPKLGGFIHQKDAPRPFRRWLAQITDRELSQYFMFAVVRDPFDRFISMAGHFELPISTLIEQYDRLKDDEPYKSHFAPQIDYTHLHGRQFVDRILRFETLSADFAKLLDDLSLPPWPLPHANRSDRSELPAQLTDAEADFVARIYADDIAAYGYPHRGRAS